MTNTIHDINDLGQPVGLPVDGWQGAPRPLREVMSGRFCRLEPADPNRHATDLFASYALDGEGRTWTYLPYGPFTTVEEYRSWMTATCLGEDPLFFAIVDNATDQAVGLAAYLRIDPKNGVIEVGHLSYSPLLQRTPAATEAMYLMMKGAFELGYRRYEWKCNALNTPSRSAAQRLGFTYEGLFRQAIVVRGRNRDTAWYSIIDKEWPAVDAAFRHWLAPENFDEDGRQRASLSDLTRRALASFNEQFTPQA